MLEAIKYWKKSNSYGLILELLTILYIGINFNEKSNGTKQKEEIVQLAIAQLEETFSRQNLIMQDVHFQRGCVEMKCDY